MPRSADDVQVPKDCFEWPSECDESLRHEIQGCEFACEIFKDRSRIHKEGTYSNPASPVSVASREGFSKRHSSPAFRQRLHGGLSAPSHLIFCFLQAFWIYLRI